MNKRWMMTTAAVIICFCMNLSFVQDVYPAQDTFLDVSVTEIAASDTEDEGSNVEIEQRITKIRGTLPLPLGNGDILILQAAWQVHDLDISEFTTVSNITEDDFPEQLYSGDIAVGLMHRFSDR